MISSGDSLRPNRLKPGDLILHFIGDEDEIRFIVMSCIDGIVVDGEELSMAVESLVSIIPYKDFLN